jgi:hypothetical protein
VAAGRRLGDIWTDRSVYETLKPRLGAEARGRGHGAIASTQECRMSETTVYTDFRLHAKHLAETGERAPAEVAVRRDLAAAYQRCDLIEALPRTSVGKVRRFKL